MSVHVKASLKKSGAVLLEAEEKSIPSAIGLVRLNFNRNNCPGNLLVEIDGKQALYDPWHMVFYAIRTAGCRLIRTPARHFAKKN